MKKMTMFFLTLAVMACAPDQQVVTPPAAGARPAAVRQNQPRPDWIDNVPEASFIGIASNVRTEEMARSLALDNAREQIAKYLGQTIEIDETARRTITMNNADPILVKTVQEDLNKRLVKQIVDRAKDRTWHTERQESAEGTLYKVFVKVKFSDEDGGAAVAGAFKETEAGYRDENKEQANRVLGTMRNLLLGGR